VSCEQPHGWSRFAFALLVVAGLAAGFGRAWGSDEAMPQRDFTLLFEKKVVALRARSTLLAATPVDWCVTDGCSASS
jgi:hypothetical protein